MRKNILAVAVLSAICGFAQADDISSATSGASIDIFQVAGTFANADNVTITSVDQGQVNVVNGNSDANVISITQSVASKANLVMGAQLPDDGGNGSNSMSAGNRATGAIVDISAATLGQFGSTFDNSDAATMNGANNVTIQQDGENAIANMAVDGSGNTIALTQAVTGSVVNAVISATGATYTITQ